MVGLIQILFIVGIVYILIVNKRKSIQNKNMQNGGRNGQAPNTTVTPAGQGGRYGGGMMQNGNQPNGQWAQGRPGGSNMQGAPNGQWAQGRPGGSGMQSAPNGQWAQGRPGGSGMQSAPNGQWAQNRPGVQTAEREDEEESTTAYLAKKAEEDAREHAQEKWEEEKRLRESRGGFAVAERHLDGDPVPQGKRCLVCGYCGAENLVPVMMRSKYSCYFCRELLG